MYRLPKNSMIAGTLVLALLMLTVFLASCGSDDPVAPEATNQAPGAPAIDVGSGAPADTATDIALGVLLHWTCTDPDDDPLTYTIHFGTAAAPPMVAENQASGSYTPTGLANGTIYYWQVIAKDDGAKSTSSDVWSFTTVAAGAETISTPTTPSGSASVFANVVSSFSTAGAISSEGHNVEYRFDWGDGTMSAWVTPGTRTHAWAAAGTFEVAAQARCVVDTDVESAWSTATTVTVVAVTETVSQPNTPTGQTSGEPGETLVYAVTGSGSSDGHAIEYRFDWDDGTMSDWAVSGDGSHAWTSAGSYNVKALARCVTHNEIESAWSRVRIVTIAVAVETVSAPSVPTGIIVGEIDVPQAYSATGAVSSVGHTLEYRFDWGDGSLTDWGAATDISHVWTVAGNYQVKAQARCAVDTAIESAWSPGLLITVNDPPSEIVNVPAKPAGPSEGELDVPYTYVTSGSVSTEGHTVEYRFEWADGSYSEWGPSGSASHAWSTSGYYQVRAQARCQDHITVESAWSSAFQIAIAIGEIVYPPSTSTGPETLEVGESGFYRTRGGISNLGHNLAYRCDWGNGVISDWADVTGIRYTWDTAGIYDVLVQARCVEHPDVESGWSYAALTVTVLDPETVSAPDAPSGPDTGIVQDILRYDFTGAVSSWGHTLQYRVDWGEGLPTSWGINDFHVHSWNTVGTYDIMVQARCTDHPTVESAWSATSSVVISLPPEEVGPAYIGSHPSVGGIGEMLEFSIASGMSNVGHPTELQIDWGDGTISDWGPKVGLHYVRSHAWAAAGTYQVTAHARCIEHPEYMSDWVTPVSIEILASETVTVPSLGPGGEVTYDLNRYINITARFSISNMAHSVEYQFDVNGTLTEWDLYGSESLATDVPIDYVYKARARCADHPDVVSDWTPTSMIHIVDLENVTTPTLGVPASGTVGVPVIFTVSGAESSFGHTLEYQLYWGLDYYLQHNPQGWTTSDNLTITWDSAAYTKYVFVKARCADHPDVESAMSTYKTITITD